MIKVKLFDHEHEKDLEKDMNHFLEKIEEKSCWILNIMLPQCKRTKMNKFIVSLPWLYIEPDV